MALGGAEKACVVPMWTRRVEWARASRFSSCRWSSVGEWKIISHARNKIRLEAPPGDMPWPPKAAPAPVRGPSEDVSIHDQTVISGRPFVPRPACKYCFAKTSFSCRASNLLLVPPVANLFTLSLIWPSVSLHQRRADGRGRACTPAPP